MSKTAQTLPQLARISVESYVKSRELLSVPEQGLDDFRNQKAGVFVTLMTSKDQLRGCIGTIRPVYDNVLLETIQNSVSAAQRDPRFRPVSAEELENLVYSVSVLHDPEPANSLDELNPQKYGVIVAAQGRRGLLLPDLEGIETAQQQVHHAMLKAGLKPGTTIELYRFQVDKYAE